MGVGSVVVAKRYLVTGGCGFIGSHLVDLLLKQGHSVCVLDDLSTGQRDNIDERAEFIEGSITVPEIVRTAAVGVNGIFHLAAIASVRRCIDEWSVSSGVNLLGSINVFEAANTAGIPFVYASSAAVYGDCKPPCSIDTPPGPLSAYGVDKLSMELHASASAVTLGTRSFGLRFFNIYGPRQDPSSPYSGVIAIFMEQIAKGKAITVFGDGRQSRDFVYVGDAVNILYAAMRDLERDTAARADVENVGMGVQVDLNTLAGVIADVVGEKVDICYEAARLGDIRHSAAAPSQKLRALDAEPGTSLKDGLTELYRHWVDSAYS